MSTSKGMDKLIKSCPYNGTLLSSGRQQAADIHNSVGESQSFCIERKLPDTRGPAV